MDRPRPQKKKLSKRLGKSQMEKNQMIKNLAESVLEVLKEECLKMDDPFECYAHQLRMRICKEAKVFSGRSIQGYEILLEQLRAQNKSSD